MSNCKKLYIFYSGADGSWEEIQAKGFNRRNTCLLKALAQHHDVEMVYVVTPIQWHCWLRQKKFGIFIDSEKAQSFFLPLFPWRTKFNFIEKLNNFLWQRLVRLQVKSKGEIETHFYGYWPKGVDTALRLTGNRSVIFDADHNIIDDLNADSNSRQKVFSILETNSDRVLGIAAARTMLKHFATFNIPSFRIRNGVDPERFRCNQQHPPELHALPRPIIGYVGTVSRWLNLELLAELGRSRQDWSFVIIGDAYKCDALERISFSKNVYFLGARRADSIPTYISMFDCALNLYRCENHEGMDPDSMKLFEYLAAGVPVVSTTFHSWLNDDFFGLLKFGATKEDVITGIEQILNYSIHERSSWLESAKRFAENNSWRVRANEVVLLMQEKVNVNE